MQNRTTETMLWQDKPGQCCHRIPGGNASSETPTEQNLLTSMLQCSSAQNLQYKNSGKRETDSGI